MTKLLQECIDNRIKSVGIAMGHFLPPLEITKCDNSLD